MKDFFEDIAEQKIKKSIARGESKNLSGAGKPVNIENFYFLPPEFIFTYTVLKNSGYLNLAEDEKAPVSLSNDGMNLSDKKLTNYSSIVQEEPSDSLVSNKIASLDVKPTRHAQEKALNYNKIRDSRRGRF